MIFLFIAAAFIFGACVGSFLNVVILRLPKGNSLGGRSYCPHCHRTLVASDLFPIVSYILLRGRCRGCKKPISSRYALIEAVTGSLFALGFAVVYPQAIVDVIELARVWLVLSTLIVVFMIDLEHYLILNKVVIVSTAMLLFITILADIVARYYNPHAPLATVSGVLAAVASAGIFFLIWYFSKGRAMGLGDAKLLVHLY
jgi:prepilin signal peptidase PulO-like enzyme (type II secretory pathway)